MPTVLVEPTNPDRWPKPPKSRGKKIAKLLAGPDVHVVTPQSQELSRAAHEKARAAHLQTLKELSEKHEESAGRLRYLLEGFPDDPSPEVTTKGADGEPLTFKLLNRDAKIHDAVVGARALHSRTNLADIYRELYDIAAYAAFTNPEQAPRELGDLPNPASMHSKSASAISDAITAIATVIESFFVLLRPVMPDVPPAGFPGQCSAEEGTGNGGDMISGPATLNPLGLRQKCNWPLKWYTTCVRNQGGKRGTCSAFSVVAAVEARIAAVYNRWVNVSEQDLYKHCRHDWFPWPLDWYGDGFTATVSVFGQMTFGYAFPWERDWNYNPSPTRNEDDAHHIYTHSCDGYAGQCSDTNHQSHRTCSTEHKEVLVQVVRTVSHWVEDVVGVFEDIFNWITGSSGHWVSQQVTEWEKEVETFIVCTYDTAIPGTSGARILAANPFYVYGVLIGPQAGTAIARSLLAAQIPISLGLPDLPSFDGATSGGGYVTFDPNETDSQSRGGHCVCMTGWVPNSQVPAGAPQAAGNGYFVIKNSWGRNWGDGGYAYLPEAWVEKWATEMVAVPVVVI